MAIARLCVKVGKLGKATPHANYIARQGQYAKAKNVEKTEAVGHGNMPSWAKDDPSRFWQAADACERKNGTAYREFEIALPREMTPEQRLTLLKEFIENELGEKHAYQFAIHNPKGADGQDQPHAHLMFSERQNDGIERDPEQYFKRYNPKNPEKGGAKKGFGPRAGQTLTREERANELKELRGRWETLCNDHLARVGAETRIDMRSHADRGTGLEPERKLLPSEWRRGKGKILEFRQARRELLEARVEVKTELPNVQAEIVSLEEARTRRQQQAEAQAQAKADPLYPYRRRLAEAEAKRDELGVEIAKAELELAEEYQAKGYNLRHVGYKIIEEGEKRGFEAFREKARQELEQKQKPAEEAKEQDEARRLMAQALFGKEEARKKALEGLVEGKKPEPLQESQKPVQASEKPKPKRKRDYGIEL